MGRLSPPLSTARGVWKFEELVARGARASDGDDVGRGYGLGNWRQHKTIDGGSMRTTKKSWIKHWMDYGDGQPADVYYRIGDVRRTLAHYGHDEDKKPDEAINPYSDAWYLICQVCQPYRVVR